MPSVETAATDESADRHSPEDQVFRAYVSLVSHLEFTRSSTVEYTDDGACIWTVIDAAPEDREVRERIYEAELRASDASPDADVTFRLVNLREYAPDALSRLLPASSPSGQRRTAAS